MNIKQYLNNLKIFTDEEIDFASDFFIREVVTKEIIILEKDNSQTKYLLLRLVCLGYFIN